MKLEVSTLAEAIAIAVSLADRGALKTTGLRLLRRAGPPIGLRENPFGPKVLPMFRYKP